VATIRVRQPRLVKREGYVLVYAKGHPNARLDGRIPEHVKVMSDVLGRPLFPGENVHHKNGHKADNRPGTLELWFVRQPHGQRVEDLVAWAKELLTRYEPAALR
jgi:hypothetical protein